VAPDTLVAVRDLTRRFGSFVAVDHVSFDLPRGIVFGVLGPNGAGKSTTIRMLAGLLAPTGGTVRGLGGLDVARDTEAWKRRIGYMSQRFSLYTDLTVQENLRFFGRVYGLAAGRLAARIGEVTARLHIDGLRDSPTATLSTGQRQRVALAAALLHEPELLFLDEPTGGVDPHGRRIFWDLIYELAADRGMTVVVTTHYMDEAEQCDRLLFFLDGLAIADGSPLELKRGLAGRIFQLRTTGDAFEALAAVRADAALEDAYLFGVTLRVVARPGREAEAHALAARAGAVRAADPTLEDVFVSLARSRARGGKEVAA
jgi:ABC-2 type transport system ATP-binding protein